MPVPFPTDDQVNLPFIDAEENAESFATRAEGFRMRMTHTMVLSALVLRPVPQEVAAAPPYTATPAVGTPPVTTVGWPSDGTT